jgi:hypothetical protein
VTAMPTGFKRLSPVLGAITATAPASSAILACSGVTTSMMTPPLSIESDGRVYRHELQAVMTRGVAAMDETFQSIHMPGATGGA